MISSFRRTVYSEIIQIKEHADRIDPELYPSKILIHGPSGNHPIRIAQSIARSISSEVKVIEPHHLFDVSELKTLSKISEVFEKARSKQRQVLIFPNPEKWFNTLQMPRESINKILSIEQKKKFNSIVPKRNIIDEMLFKELKVQIEQTTYPQYQITMLFVTSAPWDIVDSNFFDSNRLNKQILITPPDRINTIQFLKNIWGTEIAAQFNDDVIDRFYLMSNTQLSEISDQLLKKFKINGNNFKIDEFELILNMIIPDYFEYMSNIQQFANPSTSSNTLKQYLHVVAQLKGTTLKRPYEAVLKSFYTEETKPQLVYSKSIHHSNNINDVLTNSFIWPEETATHIEHLIQQNKDINNVIQLYGIRLFNLKPECANHTNEYREFEKALLLHSTSEFSSLSKNLLFENISIIPFNNPDDLFLHLIDLRTNKVSKHKSKLILQNWNFSLNPISIDAFWKLVEKIDHKSNNNYDYNYIVYSALLNTIETTIYREFILRIANKKISRPKTRTCISILDMVDQARFYASKNLDPLTGFSKDKLISFSPYSSSILNLEKSDLISFIVRGWQAFLSNLSSPSIQKEILDFENSIFQNGFLNTNWNVARYLYRTTQCHFPEYMNFININRDKTTKNLFQYFDQLNQQKSKINPENIKS